MSLEKAFFPIIPKLVIALFALFATSTGILVNVIFFAPSLGLFDILGHWQAEQLPFTVSSPPTEEQLEKGYRTKMLNGSNGDMLRIHNQALIPWGLIDRWSEGEPPSYTLYTIFNLRTFFILFFVIKLLQTVIIFIVKRVTSPSFKKAGLIKQIIHAFENTSISVPFKDWEIEAGTVIEHRQRLQEVVKEVLLTLAVNKVIGLIMLLPLICTGIYSSLQILVCILIKYLVYKIDERHQLLSKSIGTRPEEDVSYSRAQVILPAVIVFFVVGSFVEAAAYWLFNYKVQCWA